MTEKATVDALFSNPQPSKLASRILGKEKMEVPAPVQTPEAATEKKPEIDEMEELRRTVIICNLPTKCTARDIKKLFEGKKDRIVNIRMRSLQLEAKNKLPRKVAVRRGAIDEEGTCNAFVHMKAPSDVTEAIDKLNGKLFMEKRIRVDQATAAGKKNRVDKETNKRSVFVGHVPFDATEEELHNIFEKCGKIHHVRIPRDDTGKGRGIAYVTFEEEESVDFALQFNKAEFKKQTLLVERSNPAKGEKTKKKHEMGRSKTGKGKGKFAQKPAKTVKKPAAKTGQSDEKKPKFEGKRAKANLDNKNKTIKEYLKMRSHAKKKKAAAK